MKTSILALVAGVGGVALSLAANAATLYVECESFDSLGGWVVDPHSMKAIESSYVMAHGVGKPVADAVTTVEVPAAGRYAVWAKTRDWAAEWREGRGRAPGRFKVVVNGAALDSELGTDGREWHWQKAGEVNLPKGAATLALHDITGFNGRCDAIFLTDDLSASPPFARPAVAIADNPVEYDLAIVGGGVAGICMAQTAARYGVKTLLLQNRDVLGGCNSSEVRVGLGGYWHIDPYPNLGNVVDEIAPAFNNNRPLPPEFYEDARKANFFVRSKSNCDVFYREHVFAIETDPADAKRIVAVLSRNTHTGRVTRHRARLFCDATGDATLARLVGCETMYGREARSRFNESCAPEKADRQVMGHSTQWTSRIANAPVAFPDIDWGFVLDESNAYHITEGGWEQEAGQYRDMADDTEAIRDYGLYAVFSNWSYLKNRSPRKAEWAKREITWISPIGGKRESYRVVGDFVLTQNDIENHVRHSDLTAPITWNIDIHFPDPDNEAKFKEPFRSCAYHRCFNGPYAMPYRCLYARDAKNLFLAGRDISCSHVAFAATRVMGTLGVCGEVTGMAAAICKKHGCMPRDVYERHLEELKDMMEKGVPRPRFYHSGGCSGELEYYHLKADDEDERPRMHPDPTPLTPSQERKIRALGVKHRHEHPQLAKTPEHRRLVLADESRGLLHYYDSECSAAGFSIKMEKPLWDLTRIGEGRYRAVCHKGFMVADLKERKVVDVFRHDSLDEVTSVCDLPDGGFIASVNPSDAKEHVILVRRFSKDRELVSTAAFRGIYYGRGLSRLENGDLLIGHETGFAVCRLPEGCARDADGEIVKNIAMPKGRNLFEVVPNREGTGYWAGAGYGAQLLRFDLDGNLLSAWSADQGEKKNYFYAQVREQPNGHVYVANWTGHGENDSKRGWQVIEFDEKGNAVWHLDDPTRFGSIHGLDVLGTVPPSAKAAETISADVAVVGGGSAGFAAAMTAAELGSSVVLIEKERVLGGASTLGGVNNWEPVWGATGLPRRVYGRLSRIPGAAGVYEVGIHFGWQKADEVKFPGGIVRLNPSLSYEDTLRRHGPGLTDVAWFRRNCHGIVFEPKAMEETMAAMLGETGRCRVLLGTECTGVEHEGGRVSALRLSDGRTVRARIVVDACSAVCKIMGCEMMSGREAKSAYNEPGAPDSPSGRMNGATLIYRVTPRTDGGEGLHALPEGVPEDCWWGMFPIAFCITYPNGDIGVNMLPTMSGEEALRMGAKSAYEECLRRVHAHWRWMQGRWPEFRRFRMGEICPVLALRETSRVRGDYVLNQNDLIAGMSGQKHDDLIAFADHCMDSHGGGGPGGELREPYGIPYRCLLPRGTENVLIAGRCASFSSIAASSCRLSRTMMQLGEAAGAAAHLAASRGCGPRGVPVSDIRAAMAGLDSKGDAGIK